MTYVATASRCSRVAWAATRACGVLRGSSRGRATIRSTCVSHGYVDHEHRVEAVRLTGLDQQRDVVHHDGRPPGAAASSSAAAGPDQRVQDRLEPPPGRLVAEDHAPRAPAGRAPRPSVEHLVARTPPRRPPAPAYPARPPRGPAASASIDHGPQLRQHRGHRALAGGDSAGQSHMHRRSHAGEYGSPAGPPRLDGPGGWEHVAVPSPDLAAGDRVALLRPRLRGVRRPGDRLLRRGRVAGPARPAADRHASAEACWPTSTRRWSWTTEQERSTSCERLPRPLRGDLPRCRPMHVTSGTTGRPKGVWSGLLDEPAAPALVDGGADAVGLRGRRRQPGAQPAAPLGAAAVRHRHAAGRRAGRRTRRRSTRRR